jgi:membrane-bound serine protease (ClpP class)
MNRRVPAGRLRAAFVALAAASVVSTAQASEDAEVLVIDVVGPITPVTAVNLSDAVEAAAAGGYEALVVSLDTPGGLDTSMREIVQTFLNAPVPVVVYVAPSGARAASAGAIITLSAHVAAMAPGTTIGAATPVDLEGGEISDKIINDAASYAVSIAEQRGRDPGFAEDAVRDGRSVGSTEAVEIGAVDLLARDLDELLATIDGTIVEVQGVEVTLATAAATVDRHDPGWARGLLARIADPNLAFIFLSLGSLAIIYEIANPGLGLGGIAGVILLVLAFFALSVLPVDTAGLALLVLALGLLVAELFVPGVGVMAAGGVIALVLAGLFLFEGDELRVSPAVLLPTAIVLGVGTVIAGRLTWAARKAPPSTGIATLVGRSTEIRRVDHDGGEVFLEGAWWRARGAGGGLETGQRVRVTAVEGLDLIVEPDEGETWTASSDS